MNTLSDLLILSLSLLIVDCSVRDGVESEVLTGAQVAFVAAAGHVPFAEQPHDFLLVVEEFLAELGEV